MVKTQNIDTDLLEKYIASSGLKTSFICEQLGITKQAFSNKKLGRFAFRQSEVYVLCDLLKITDKDTKDKIFFPEC